MIEATDQWKRPVIKINGKAITRPIGQITLDDDIETELIRSGLAIAVGADEIDDSEESEIENSGELEIENSEEFEVATTQESVRKTRRATRK